MTRLFSSRRVALAATAFLALCVSSACDGDTKAQPAETTSQAPTFPYPRLEIRRDIAVPLDPRTLEAATVALDSSVDRQLSDAFPDDGEIRGRFLRSVSPEAEGLQLKLPDNHVGVTGGSIQRVVGASEAAPGTVSVSVCSYETPGIHALTNSGEWVAPDPRFPFYLERVQVQWTKELAADGSAPDEPRWLVVDAGDLDGSSEDAQKQCGPFTPDPFVQQKPNPTSTDPSPPTG
jgi:hypothetical protein